MSALHGYVCECSRRRCRERIYLAPAEYRRQAVRGRLVVLEHVEAVSVVLERRRLSGYALVGERGR